MKEKESLIYILTNEDYPENCVKIGYTTDLKARLNNLSTGLLHDFEVYAIYHVPHLKGRMPDKLFHNMLENIDPSIRYTKKKEFFLLYPEQAYDILKDMALIHNREDCLELRGVYNSKRLKINAEAQKEKAKQPKANKETTFFSPDKKATMLYSQEDNKYIVLKGSEIKLASDEPAYKTFKKQQDDLIANGGVISQGDTWVTNFDLTFNSPSGAANFVRGMNINGKLFWKNSKGVTLKDMDK